MKLKARGDWGWFVLSPEFTKREARQLAGKCGIAVATKGDIKNLPLHVQSKDSVKKACGVK